jgi:hypothetical protein
MSFLECNIWEINQFPKYGEKLNRYTLANIFPYNSNCKVYQSNNFYIQIPEFEIQATEHEKLVINKYKEIMVRNRIPFIVLTRYKDNDIWKVDLAGLDFLLHKGKD